MEGWKERDKTDSQRRLSLSRQWWQCKFGIVSPWKMPESLFTGLSALFSLHFRDIPFPASFPFNIRENGERLIVPRHPETPLLSARYRLPSSRLDRLGRLVGPRTGSVVFHGAPLPTKDGRARGCVRVWVWPLSLSLSRLCWKRDWLRPGSIVTRHTPLHPLVCQRFHRDPQDEWRTVPSNMLPMDFSAIFFQQAGFEI